jgi:amino acid transporter
MASDTGAGPGGAHEVAVEVDPIHGGEFRLASNALGLSGVLFCIVTGAAPIAAMLFNVPVTVLGSGYASPATFWIATVVLTLFSVGYVEMARRVTAAGGFYSFVSHGFGQVVGMGTAVTITLCYVLFSAGVSGVTAYFANSTINDWFGVDIPAWLIMFVLLGVMLILAFFHIELTAAILGVCLVTEVIALLVFGFAVLFQGGDSGIPFEPLSPAAPWDDANTAILGASATGVALFGSFWSWVGFEMAPNYAEESRDPRRIMAVATYVSVIGLGVLYTFISWMFVAGWGQDNVAAGVVGQFEGAYGSAFYPLTDEYFGELLTWAFELLIVTGSFACQLAFFNTANRYFFSMGREGILPRALGKTHPTHKSPFVAAIVTTVLTGAIMLGFVLHDDSTLAALAKQGTWVPLMGMLGILVVQALVSAAIIYYFATKARDGMHWFKTVVAPVLGGVGCLYAAYLLVDNRETLAAGNPLFIAAVPWAIAAFFIIGVAIALFYRSTDPKRYEAIGRYVHQDA